MVVSFTLSRAGLEVYTTQDNPKIKLTDSTEEKSNFPLLNGEVNQIDYIGEVYSDSYEHDYSDISSNASISLPMDYYSTLFKGKKIALKKGINPSKWKDMETAVLGFVTEISYSKDKIDIKINGMDKLLEQEKKFRFSKTKRSKIVKKIIEASGLKAKVDVTGLKDDVTDFTNISSSSDNSSSAGGIDTSTDLGKLCAKIVGDETDPKKRLDKLHQWGQDNITYDGYECSRYGCNPDKCYQNRGHLNCGDTAVLMHKLYTLADLDCYIIHGNYHFWNIITINGKKYASDCSGNHSLNQVWSTSAHPNSPFSGNKANPDAICG